MFYDSDQIFEDETNLLKGDNDRSKIEARVPEVLIHISEDGFTFWDTPACWDVQDDGSLIFKWRSPIDDTIYASPDEWRWL